MEERLPFVLALIGGIFALGGGLMMALMMMVMLGVSPMGGLGGAASSVFGLLFGWLVLTGLAGGAAALVGAVKLYREPASQRGATWAIAGGAISTFGGNLLAGALCIGGGALALSFRPRV